MIFPGYRPVKITFTFYGHFKGHSFGVMAFFDKVRGDYDLGNIAI